MKKIRFIPLLAVLALSLSVPTLATSQTLAMKQTDTKLFVSKDRPNLSDVDRVKQSYLKSLDEQNEGVVEAAIQVLVKFKLVYPELDFVEIENKLHLLELSGQTASIRHKSYIARNYLNNPSLYNNIENVDYLKELSIERTDEFFRILGDTLQRRFLGQ